jgi:Ser/Thr protein kinase RdoA (MazF antagonist)
MSIPLSVRNAYGFSANDADLDIQHIPSNINATFVIRRRRPMGEALAGETRSPRRVFPNLGHEALVLQRLHRVFGAQVHVDIEAVTAHLAAKGVETPRLVRTQSGELWTTDPSSPEQSVWRALSFVDGITLHHTRDAATLESAAALLGTFQRNLADLEHEFVHERPLHDTRRHLAQLQTALGSQRGTGDAEAQELGSAISRQVEGVRLDFGSLPKRIIHGDPKLSNVLFERDLPSRARCMIDLDTVGRGYVAYELGDALRSWCNPAGEDIAAPSLELDSFAAVMRGYARTCPDAVTPAELLSAIDGFETVSLELASRFAADAINDSYFGWDAQRFGSRREHNLLRARGQLALSRAVRAQRAVLVDVATRALESARRS